MCDKDDSNFFNGHACMLCVHVCCTTMLLYCMNHIYVLYSTVQLHIIALFIFSHEFST